MSPAPVSKGDRWISHAAYDALSNSLAFYYPDTGELQYVNVVLKATRTLTKLASPPKDMAIAGENVLIVTGGDVQILVCDSGETIATVHVDGLPAENVAAGNSGDLFVVGHGRREKQPCKLVVRSSKTGKQCLEFDYPRGLGKIWFAGDQRIVLGRCLGELLRWKLPKDCNVTDSRHCGHRGIKRERRIAKGDSNGPAGRVSLLFGTAKLAESLSMPPPTG